MSSIVQLGEVGEVAHIGKAAVKRNSGTALNFRPQTSKTPTSDFDESVGHDLPCSKTNASSQIVMRKYVMQMDKASILGEGTSTICRKGLHMQSRHQLAIKIYKTTVKSGGAKRDVVMCKFKRLIGVLTELQKPFTRPNVKALWCADLVTAKPSSLFMALVDYSRDSKGNAAADPDDDVVYVIAELGQYNLKDYLALRKQQGRPMPREALKSVTKAIILVVAGLHAKGFAHLDMKPENLMMFNGRLKLIDCDGCVKIGSNVSITDSTVSFSPCYCAPEWAGFLINDDDEDIEEGITVHPAFDVWSVGMTICEFIVFSAVLKPKYTEILKNSSSHKEAGYLFMDWLSNIQEPPLPKQVEKSDQEFYDLIKNWLLVCDHEKRKSCAQCMSHPFLVSATERDKEIKAAHMDIHEEATDVARRIEDTSEAAVFFKGMIWKLNARCNPKDSTQWLKLDMWIAETGSLCYFNTQENKRLVLVEGTKLAGATVTKYEGAAKQFAFQLTYKADGDDDKTDTALFACESGEEYNNWTTRLTTISRMDVPSMKLGEGIRDLRKFIISVKNRRQKIDESDADAFQPVFKKLLWKLKAEGNKKRPEDWFEREMWIAKNGSLVYYSKKEKRNLVYYTAADLKRATYSNVSPKESCKPFAFLVHLPKNGDVEFAPGEFAGETSELRDRWIREFKKLSANGKK